MRTSAEARFEAVRATLAFVLSVLSLAVSLLLYGDDGTSTKRLLTLPVEIQGELTPARAEAVSSRAVGGLRRSSMEVTEPPPETTCQTVECWSALDPAADYLVRIRLQIESGQRKYRVQIEVISPATRDVLVALSDTCDLCGFGEALDMVEAKAAAATAAIERLGLDPSTVTVTSRPSPAEVIVDGELVGSTPITLPLEPGSHAIELRKPGYLSQAADVEVVEGVSKQLRLQLIPETEPRASSRSDDGRALILAGAGILGASVAALAAGAALVVIDERSYRRDCQTDPFGNCRFEYDTLAGGITSLALGGAGVAVSAGLLGTGLLRRKGTQRQVALGMGPAGFVIRW